MYLNSAQLLSYISNQVDAYTVNSAQVLPIATWIHLSVTYNAGTLCAFSNGVQTACQSGASFSNVVRTINYIGRSNYASDSLINDALFDELTIFNRPLNSREINYEMNRLQPHIIDII